MTTLMLNRSHLVGGFQQAFAPIRVIARAFTFANLVFSVLFAFLYMVAPLWSGLQPFWCSWRMNPATTGMVALRVWLDRLCEMSPKAEMAITASVTLIFAAFLGFIACNPIFENLAKHPHVPRVRYSVRPARRIWCCDISACIRRLRKTAGIHWPGIITNVGGITKIERLGPGHYEVWVHKEGCV